MYMQEGIKVSYNLHAFVPAYVGNKVRYKPKDLACSLFSIIASASSNTNTRMEEHLIYPFVMASPTLPGVPTTISAFDLVPRAKVNPKYYGIIKLRRYGNVVSNMIKSNIDIQTRIVCVVQ